MYVTLQPPEMRDSGREVERLHRPLESILCGLTAPCLEMGKLKESQ